MNHHGKTNKSQETLLLFPNYFYNETDVILTVLNSHFSMHDFMYNMCEALLNVCTYHEGAI